MIKKIRRKRTVIRQKEIIVVKNANETMQTCPVCHAVFVGRETLSPAEQKQLPPAEIADKHECS